MKAEAVSVECPAPLVEERVSLEFLVAILLKNGMMKGFISFKEIASIFINLGRPLKP